MPRRQPRKPSIGLNSWSSWTRCWIRSAGDAELLRQFRLLLLGVRQELVQRRIQEANRRRIALQRPEDAGEVLALVRQQLGERRLPLLERLGEDHLAHRVDAVALEEHVLGAGEADADGAERHRVRASAPACRRWCARSCASPLAHHFISCWKFLNFSVACAASSPSMRPATISDGAVLTWPA